jgi:hypothetical protein
VRKTVGRLAWVSVYAAAMALLEAVVVVYLRGLIEVSADQVSLGAYVRMEVWREAATLAMLAAIGWLAAERAAQRPWYAAYAFGLWDLAYYAWLKVLIDWPAGLLDWDVLFLIPLPWWGPVLAPALVAALICVAAAVAVLRLQRGGRILCTPWRIAVAVSGALGTLYAFMFDALAAWGAGLPAGTVARPSRFQWPLFLACLLAMAVPVLLMVCGVPTLRPRRAPRSTVSRSAAR